MKYFEDYYVGCRTGKEMTASGMPLGFAVPDGTDSAAKKRKHTVDGWVIGSTYYNRGKDIPARGKVYKNKPRRGFILTEWNGRYVTDNKVVRVLDPLGFELEIYIPNLMDIILSSKIDHGEIDAEMVWLRDGPNNRLVRTDSREFAEAEIVNAETQKRKSKPKASHVPGDIIQNTWGDWLYVGLMDVEHIIPRGERAVNEKLTAQRGWQKCIKPGASLFSMNSNDYEQTLVRRFWTMGDDVLEGRSQGRRHVYIAQFDHGEAFEVTLRKSKMAATKVISSGNPLPELGEQCYFQVDYDGEVVYDMNGDLYKNHEQVPETHPFDSLPETGSSRSMMHISYGTDFNTSWTSTIVRIQDGKFQTAPDGEPFDTRMLHTRNPYV